MEMVFRNSKKQKTKQVHCEDKVCACFTDQTIERLLTYPIDPDVPDMASDADRSIGGAP